MASFEVGVPIVDAGALSQVGVHTPLHTMMEVVVGLVCFLFLWNPCVHVRVHACVCVLDPKICQN